MRSAIRTWLTASAVVAALVVPGSVAAAYEPFVSDFPKGLPPVEPYEPFVTDFGKASIGSPTPTVQPTAQPVVESRAPAATIEWPSVVLGVAVGLVLAAVLAGLLSAVRRHRRAAVA